MNNALSNTVYTIEALADWAADIIDNHGWTILFIVAPVSIAGAFLAGFIL